MERFQVNQDDKAEEQYAAMIHLNDNYLSLLYITAICQKYCTGVFTI